VAPVARRLVHRATNACQLHTTLTPSLRRPRCSRKEHVNAGGKSHMPLASPFPGTTASRRIRTGRARGSVLG